MYFHLFILASRRTPINGIIGMAELTLDSDLNRSQRESLLCIHSSARSLVWTINDISDISNRKYPGSVFRFKFVDQRRIVDIGRMVMDRVPFSFRQTVFGILKTLVPRAAGNNVHLTYDVDPGIPNQLIGDPLRLQQVITTLVGNAIKFQPSRCPNGGHVALSCRQLALDDSSVALEFCVSDDGIGMSKGKLKSICDILARVDCSAFWVIIVSSFSF